jgi:hypothetical protein
LKLGRRLCSRTVTSARRSMPGSSAARSAPASISTATPVAGSVAEAIVPPVMMTVTRGKRVDIPTPVATASRRTIAVFISSEIIRSW